MARQAAILFAPSIAASFTLGLTCAVDSFALVPVIRNRDAFLSPPSTVLRI